MNFFAMNDELIDKKNPNNLEQGNRTVIFTFDYHSFI